MELRPSSPVMYTTSLRPALSRQHLRLLAACVARVRKHTFHLSTLLLSSLCSCVHYEFLPYNCRALIYLALRCVYVPMHLLFSSTYIVFPNSPSLSWIITCLCSIRLQLHSPHTHTRHLHTPHPRLHLSLANFTPHYAACYRFPRISPCVVGYLHTRMNSAPQQR